MVFQRRLTTEERLRLREHEARVAANAKRSLSTADLSTIDGNSEPNSKRAQTDRPELRFSEPQIPVTTSLTSAYQPYEPYRRISEEDYYASFDFTFDEIDADNAPPVTVAPSAPTPVVRNSSLPAQPSGNTTTPDQRKYPIAPSKSESNSGLSKVTPNRAANNVVNGQTPNLAIPRSVNGPSKLSRVSYAGREHPKETPVSQLEKYGLLPKTSQGPSTAANSPAKQTPVAAPKATTPTKPNPQSFPQRPRVSYVGRPLPRLEDTPKSQLALLTEAELQALKQAEIASTLVPPPSATKVTAVSQIATKLPETTTPAVPAVPAVPQMSTQYAAPDYLGNEVTPWAPTQGPYDNPSSTAGPPPKPPILRSENELSISHPKWGLVDDIVSGFAAANVHEMYPWQSECLSLPEVLQGDSNLVYTAPTSAGKSLVSDILMAKRVMEDFKKVLIVVPYVSIVQEKTKYLETVFRGIRVPVGKRWRNATAVGFFSGVGSRARWKDIDVAVCTLERANAIINTAIEDRTIDDVGLVVFDELHMVDDEHRGFILEILAAKLLCLGNKIQIVGMSATLSNADTLGKWLKAQVYECSFRPIQLEEHIAFENGIFSINFSKQRELPTSDKKDMKDPVTNAAIMLTQECVSSGHGVLIFCESRAKCEDLATLMRRYIPRAPSNIEEKRRHILTELGTTAVGLDPVLEKVIPAGIAFHHAGLTSEERDIITMAYQEGTIKIIFCTATIAAGVNLPARRVIIIPHQGRDFVTATTLQQMRGRAGRKGKDTAGETFILVREKDVGPLTKLLTQPLPIVKSALLTSDTTRLSRAILEVIATHLATSTGHILDFLSYTLLFQLQPESTSEDLLDQILSDLTSQRLISSDEFGYYTPTTLGRATVTAGLTPTDGLFLNAELSVALRSFNLETDLQICYHFTPLHLTSTLEIDPLHLRQLFEALDEPSLRAALLCGVQPASITRLQPVENRIHQRFYVSLMLRQLINETPVHAVAAEFGVARGFVQQLAGTCRGWAVTLGSFCEVMGWTGLKVLVACYSGRLEGGVKEELLALARLPGVKSVVARRLWEKGLRTVEAVAEAEVAVVVEALELALPRKVQGADGRLKERAEGIKKAAQRLVELEQRDWEEE